MWDADNGKELKTFPRHIWSMKVAVSADGKLAVTGTETPRILRKGTVFSAILWSADSGRQLHIFRDVSGIALCGDGKRKAIL